MTPQEQELSDTVFNGVPVREVPPDWQKPFQPWADESAEPVVAWWAWQVKNCENVFTPVYAR